jgi:hypothetical protein
MISLTVQQLALHQQALDLSRELSRLEWRMIEVLQEIDQTKLYRHLGHSSLFQYAVNALNLSESVAYCFITVARKSKVVSDLKVAIQNQTLSVSKASRMVPVLTNQNANKLIEFAASHTTREIDFEVAKLNPKAGTRERAKPISEDRVEIKITVSRKVFEKFKRAQTLASQKGNPQINLEGTFEVMTNEYLKHQDPIEKAKRAAQREDSLGKDSRTLLHQELRPNRVEKPRSKRKPINARQKHTIILRDGGRCTFQDVSGKRCTNDRWLENHHIRQVSQGGTNDPKNLTTLCSFHHDLVHQLSLPIDGQVSWVRSPVREYKAV